MTATTAPRKPAQPFSDHPRPPVELKPVVSSKLKAMGYDPALQLLAVTFPSGTGAIYHYKVSPELYAKMLAADSLGSFFIKNVQTLPFEKYPAEPAVA